MATALLIHVLSQSRGVTTETVILLGIALVFTFNALLALLQFFASEQALGAVVFWMMGSLTKASWSKLAITTGVFALSLPFFFRRAWALTTLRLGDDKAASFGINVRRLRLEIMLLVSLLAAVPVSFVGTIGFIGLVGPHIARMVIGEDQRFFRAGFGAGGGGDPLGLVGRLEIADPRADLPDQHRHRPDRRALLLQPDHVEQETFMVSLALKGVGVSYGRRMVLQDVDTPELRGGEVVAVIGANAAGKSSLFRRIAGLVPGTGEVSISGQSIVPKRARPNACYLPQDTAVNAVLTVYESILLAFKQGGSWSVSDAELRRIDAVLRELEIEDLAFRGLGELSGGQRQLVSIAQTLAREPDILLLDEPTSALDLHRQFEVLNFISQTAKRDGMIVLIALHDLNHALHYCENTIVINGGVMAASGDTASVITREMLRDIYRIDARIERCSRGKPIVIVDGALHD
jgi:iron complex transport system ATP-binding protein